MIHLTAPDDVRVASVRKRDEEFVQTTDEDIVKKGELLAERIMVTYLEVGDCIEFWHRDQVDDEAKIGAGWSRNSEDKDSLPGSIVIKDLESYEKVKAIHDLAAISIGRPDLLWENTVELLSTYTD